MGEEWRVFPCLLPHNIYRSGLWYDNPFAWFLRAFSADDMIFLHLLEMLKDGTSIDVQSVSNLSGSDIPIAGDKVQNGISRFWTTFLDHLSGPPLFSFLSSSSFCKDTTNILISQEKMGDNIKKMANLFVISDFCSIFAEAKLHSAIWKQAFIALVCIYFAFGLIRPRVMTSVFCGLK